MPAFVSGGLLPVEAQGTYREGVTSVNDWYATLAGLVGVQVDNSGPYDSDSVDNWEYIKGGRNTSVIMTKWERRV